MNIMSSSGDAPAYQQPPQTTEQLRATAMEALSAWQARLKHEEYEQARLEGLLENLAGNIRDRRERAETDQSIRDEWRKLHPPPEPPEPPVPYLPEPPVPSVPYLPRP